MESSTMTPETKRQPESSAPQPRRSEMQESADSDSRRRQRNGLLGSPHARTVLTLGVLVLLVCGFLLWRYLSSYESTDDAQIDGHVNSVSARVSGHVIKLNVQDNQYVEKGTVLVEIDPTDYQVAVDKARAEYADAMALASAAGINVPITNVNTSSQVSNAQAEVEGAEAGISAARQQFEAAKSQVEQAEANNSRAQDDLKRYKILIDKQEISEQQYDQAVDSARATAATLAGSRASADSFAAQIKQAQSKLDQANADLQNAGTRGHTMKVIQARAQSALAVAQQKKAELDQAELNLQYTKVIAPVSGAVSNRTVEIGQNLQAGQEMLKIIPLDIDNIWVTANYKETQLRGIRPGQRVDVEVDATGKTYKAHVDSIAGASGERFSLLPPENATGNYVKVVQRIPVKIVFDPGEDKGHELRPGMSVEPKIWIK